MPGPGYTSPKSKRGKTLPASVFAGVKTKGAGKVKPRAAPKPKAAPKRTPGRYVVAPSYKAVKRGNKIVPKKKSYARRYKPKSPVFTRQPKVRGPEQYKSLSYQPKFSMSKDGLKLSKGSYKPGSVQEQAAKRFSRSPMGELSRAVRKEEKRQNAIPGARPVKLKLDRKTGKVQRIVGKKNIVRSNVKQYQAYQTKKQARADARQGGEVGKTIRGAGREVAQIGGFVTARGQSLNPAEALARIGGGEAAKKIAGKEGAKKINASGIPGLSNSLSKKIKPSTPVNLLRIVDQTQRPVLAVTGGLEKAVRNTKSGKPLTQGVSQAAGKGLKLQQRKYGSDVLKAAGIGGVAAAVGGLAIDVVADPTTYLTFGAGSAGKIGAVQAAKAVEKNVVKKETARLLAQGVEKKVAKEEAKKVGKRAYEKAYKQAEKDNRLSVRVGGKRRGKVIKSPIRVNNKPTGITGKAKSFAHHTARPQVARAGADAVQYAGASNSARTVRATVSQGIAHSQISADWLSKHVHHNDYETLIDAVETPSLKSSLPKYLTEPSVKVEVQRPEYKAAWEKAYRSGHTVEEANDIARKAVPPGKRETRLISVYDAIRADYRQQLKMRRRAGQVQGNIRDYFPHMVDEMIRGGKRRTPMEVIRGVTKRQAPNVEDAAAESDKLLQDLPKGSAARAGTTKKREMQMPISEANPILREEGKPLFSLDLPIVHASAGLQTANIRARGVAAEEIGKTGRGVRITTTNKPKVRIENGKMVEVGVGRVERTVKVGKIEPNERLYVYKMSKAKTDGGTEVPGRMEWTQATPKEAEALQSGVVPRDVRQVRVADQDSINKIASGLDQFSSVPRELQALQKLDNPSGGQKMQKAVYWTLDNIVDPPMRVWKGIATRTPQFHLRNMVGDTSMAYNAVPASRMPQLGLEAMKVTWFLRGRRKNLLGFSDRTSGTIRIGYRDKKTGRREEVMDVADFADELIDHGVIQGGVLGADLDSLSKYGARGVARRNHKVAHLGRGVDRALQDRENFMRIVVYKHFRDEGMDPQMAARKTADTLIDYGDLSPAEKEVFKRAAPFYTFAARSIPIYALTFVKRPGKIANIEKIRQETAKATGSDAESLKQEQEYRQRGYAFPIKINGTQYMPSFGLPLMALNQLPAGFSVSDLETTIKENYRFFGGSLAPTIGIPIETWRNYSFFYDKKLENDPPRGRRSPTVLPGLFDIAAAQFGGKTTASGKDNRNRTILGIGPVQDRRTGKMVTGIRGKADNAIAKTLPGAPGLVLNLSRDTNRRGQDEKQMLFSFLSGIKADKADPQAGVKERLFKELSRIDQEIADIPGKTGRDKKDKAELNKRKYQIQSAIYKLDKASGAKMPLFAPPGRKSSGGGDGSGKWG